MGTAFYVVFTVFVTVVFLAWMVRYTAMGKRWLKILIDSASASEDLQSAAHQVFAARAVQGEIVVDPQHRIVQVNPRVEYLTHTSTAGLLGQPIEDFFPVLRFDAREDTAIFQQWLHGFDLHMTVIPIYPAAPARQARPLGWLVSVCVASPAADLVTLPLLEANRKNGVQAGAASEFLADQAAGHDLRDSEERFRRLVDSVPVMIWITNAEAKFTYLNRSWLEFTGRALREDLGDGWQDCVQAGDRQSLLDLFAVAEQSGSSFSAEFRLRRADGVYRWVYCSVSSFLDEEGVFSGFIGSGLDISEQKEREHQLRTFSMAVEQNPASIMLTDPSGHIVYVNRKFVQVSGYSRLEVMGQNPRFLKSGETQENDYRDLWAKVLSGNEWHGFFHNRKKNGELFWERATVSGIANGKGEIVYLLGIKEDITEQKQAEMALQESRASLEAIYNNPQLGIALVDVNGKYLQVNQRFAQMLGYTRAEMCGITNLAVTHLEDVTETRRLYQAVINKEIPEFYLEKRYVRKDGGIFWGSLSCTPIYQPDGSVREVISFTYDINERKAIAEKLSESEEQYRSIIHASPDGILITNLDGVIRMASPSALKQWGVATEAEMIGVGIEDLLPLGDRARVRALVELMQVSYGAQVLEANGRRADGSEFSFEAALELMDAQDENLRRIVYVTRDVSERKRMEAQERQRVNMLEALRATMNDLSVELDLPTLLNAIVDRLLALLGANFGGLAMYDENSQEMLQVVSKGFARDYTGVRLPLGQGLLGQVGQSMKTVIVDNYATWEHRSSLFEEVAISMIGVPLLAGDKLQGAITVGIDANVHQFSEQDAYLIELFAQQAAVAVQNANLFSEVQRLATIDPLTNVYNRRFFFERAQKELRRSVRYHNPMTIVMLDIDHFKAVNDQFGHPCGDEVLRRVADVCRSSTRNFDVIGRYGGEEFILLLPETGLEGAIATAERIRVEIERLKIIMHNGRIGVTVSVGIASLGVENTELDQMLSQADQALYAAKQGGRNRIEIYKPDTGPMAFQ
jgi:diguanylate cyclase (GGDEF)-like protein/PAS domain S-box-containing protein